MTTIPSARPLSHLPVDALQSKVDNLDFKFLYMYVLKLHVLPRVFLNRPNKVDDSLFFAYAASLLFSKQRLCTLLKMRVRRMSTRLKLFWNGSLEGCTKVSHPAVGRVFKTPAYSSCCSAGTQRCSTAERRRASWRALTRISLLSTR